MRPDRRASSRACRGRSWTRSGRPWPARAGRSGVGSIAMSMRTPCATCSASRGPRSPTGCPRTARPITSTRAARRSTCPTSRSLGSWKRPTTPCGWRWGRTSIGRGRRHAGSTPATSGACATGGHARTGPCPTGCRSPCSTRTPSRTCAPAGPRRRARNRAIARRSARCRASSAMRAAIAGAAGGRRSRRGTSCGSPATRSGSPAAGWRAGSTKGKGPRRRRSITRSCGTARTWTRSTPAGATNRSACTRGAAARPARSAASISRRGRR